MPSKRKTMKRDGRQELGVQKAKLALFWKGKIISGDCTFTGKKYKDDEIILEIYYRTEKPKK